MPDQSSLDNTSAIALDCLIPKLADVGNQEAEMGLEHLEAVKARIEEIRRKFVDPMEAQTTRTMAGRGGVTFDGALRQARLGKTIACPEELEPVIAQIGEKYNIPSAVIKSVIRAESGFNSNAVSRVGAQGLMQLMPGTANALGVDPSDPVQNIEGGTRYLKQQLDRFGSLDLALAAYNAGPGAVIRYGGIPPYTETKNYVSKVLQNVENYSQDE
jgi:soluble lytic murein transglycosylase-like protein